MLQQLLLIYQLIMHSSRIFLQLNKSFPTTKIHSTNFIILSDYFYLSSYSDNGYKVAGSISSFFTIINKPSPSGTILDSNDGCFITVSRKVFNLR